MAADTALFSSEQLRPLVIHTMTTAINNFLKHPDWTAEHEVGAAVLNVASAAAGAAAGSDCGAL